MSGTTASGSCLCGAVRYEVEGPATEVTHCHCAMCRKQHGAAFATYGGYEKEQLRLTQGEADIQVYRSGETTERRFCRICGSSLFWLDNTGRRIWVALGTLDGDPGRPIDSHIFVGEKAPWHTITDDVPQAEGWAPYSSPRPKVIPPAES